MSSESPVAEKLPPEVLLAGSNPQLIEAGVRLLPDVETVQRYAAHENQHHQREGVLRWLADRAAELRDADTATATDVGERTDPRVEEEIDNTPASELLKQLHEHEISGPIQQGHPQQWEELSVTHR